MVLRRILRCARSRSKTRSRSPPGKEGSKGAKTDPKAAGVVPWDTRFFTPCTLIRDHVFGYLGFANNQVQCQWTVSSSCNEAFFPVGQTFFMVREGMIFLSLNDAFYIWLHSGIMCFNVWVSYIVKFIANVFLITVGGSGFSYLRLLYPETCIIG